MGYQPTQVCLQSQLQSNTQSSSSILVCTYSKYPLSGELCTNIMAYQPTRLFCLYFKYTGKLNAGSLLKLAKNNKQFKCFLILSNKKVIYELRALQDSLWGMMERLYFFCKTLPGGAQATVLILGKSSRELAQLCCSHERHCLSQQHCPSCYSKERSCISCVSTLLLLSELVWLCYSHEMLPGCSNNYIALATCSCNAGSSSNCVALTQSYLYHQYTILT